jgi:flagellar P-ring protein precursor FlgI
VVVPDTSIEIKELENRQLVELPGGVTLSEFVRALNTLGVTPRDMIAVFEALRQAGALQSELVVM